MYKLKIIFIFISCLVFCNSSKADSLKTQVEARQLTDKIMAKITTGELDAGLDMMKPYLVIPEAEFEAIRGQTKLQLPMINQRFGKTLGSEFISEEKVGESALKIVHIHRLAKHPMRWIFYFYKGQEGWVLNTFRYDDNIHGLF
jgi:hypothetical protein